MLLWCVCWTDRTPNQRTVFIYGFCIYGASSVAHQQEGALCCPVSGAPRSILLPSQNQQRDTRLLVHLCSVKHIKLEEHRKDPSLQQPGIAHEMWEIKTDQTVFPVGKWMVWGACFFRNLLKRRMLANVPLAMTASFPRREPYELYSLGVTLSRQEVRQRLNSATWPETAERFKASGGDWPPVGEVAGGGAVPGDVACRRDVVGCDRITQVQQHIGVFNGLWRRQLHGLNMDETQKFEQ